ncbi:MAG: hypothetical protein AB7P02_05260 [Alphaproteobacteria bacterium]
MTRTLTPYTAADIARMRDMAAAGMSQTRIAEAMDRTLGSIAAILSKHGIRTFGESGAVPPVRAHKTYTDEDSALIRRLVDAECDAEQIATLMGRSVGSIRNHCTRIGVDIPASRRYTAVATFRPTALRRWPAEARFEDDPRAPAWEPPWRAPTSIIGRSPIGSAAAMCADLAGPSA